MVLSRHPFTNSRFHQTTQGRKYVDWGINLSIVELPVDVNLSLRNVPSKIGNWMSDIYKNVS